MYSADPVHDKEERERVVPVLPGEVGGVEGTAELESEREKKKRSLPGGRSLVHEGKPEAREALCFPNSLTPARGGTNP